MASTKTATPPERGEPMAITAKEFCRRLSISHATLYNLMQRGEVKTFTIGKRRLIPMSEVHRLISEAR
jgi:excisionase family DNA binding protein